MKRIILRWVTNILVTVECSAAVVFIVASIAWGVTDGFPGHGMKLAGMAAGIAIVMSFCLHGALTVIEDKLK